ncbi:MAG TPA: universal stress protein [Candidatus Binatus sp.]|uniref:universal stress protein n=1 Tax=Candidatus Binatus sp. TaxID=2811406 RepID=UPI002B4A941A|nr:universal stress protein [Candidatus Binatus sp.]HKN12672.1 universal stress protein [Candidatus Binatus sp.]
MDALFKSILCPIDFDELYLDALELSKSLAQQNNAKLYVLNVMSDFGSDQGWEAGGRMSLQQQARTNLAGQVPYEFVIRTGEVVNEILAAVAVFEADLIVIPTHGRRGLKKAMLGSVAERIVRESPVPVLTLRAR